MEISSPAFGNNDYIPTRFTCDGASLSPHLEFDGVPKEARSLILIVDDPDAPNGPFIHWIVWNIPPRTIDIEEETVPEDAVEGINSAGNSGYAGPCPPSGVHHYHFKLYALDISEITLDKESGIEDLSIAMDGHVIDRAEMIGLYQRR